ncbi:putative NADP-dependent oxidoreductase YfmJ [Salinimicrobium marinum]|uniref:NADP-dependent oxidoreductase YfmJ n=1 Tax=Salinimicrobium marinum TaxID=680283 RepID=A0A918SEU3_9FLAO|nr:NADP-dependent oxidoreductase [Salinimicrobium marinum]GHA35415.1 putative NADP-dependent oxidoreductase YfmJ [Salinimicrobium marinum]
MNKSILFVNRPKGKPSLDDFKIVEEDDPQPGDGELLLKSVYISVDPYLRGRMRDEESYIPPFELNEPLESMVVAEVMESKNEHFKRGEYVSGMLKWKEYQTSRGNGLNKVDKNAAALSAYLGILGLTGLTAYLALEKIGNLKEGETLLVSGAAGAVGSVAGQIGKLRGCKVVGIAGSDEKIDHIEFKFGYDEGINYKSTDNMAEAIHTACPDGVDVYFDNVGGEILDAALANINKDARIINCGAIASYNEKKIPTGPRPEGALIKNTALMQGFLIRDHAKDFGLAIRQLATWLQEGKLRYDETVVEGFENTPQAFLDLFDGKNQGKMVVKV